MVAPALTAIPETRSTSENAEREERSSAPFVRSTLDAEVTRIGGDTNRTHQYERLMARPTVVSSVRAASMKSATSAREIVPWRSVSGGRRAR